METQAQDIRELIERTTNALREELSAGFKLGDLHLRTHIDQQFAQVSVALEAADKQIELALTAAEALEVERVTNVESRLKEIITATTDRIDSGDKQLRDHVMAQVGQIAAALEAMRRETALAHKAAEDLEKARIDELNGALEQRIARVQSELNIVHEASERAILKAEVATEKRFSAVNEFRKQLGDQTATFIPREVVDAHFEQLETRLATLEGRHRYGEGQNAAHQRQEDRAQPWQIWAVGALLTVVILVANFATQL